MPDSTVLILAVLGGFALAGLLMLVVVGTIIVGVARIVSETPGPPTGPLIDRLNGADQAARWRELDATRRELAEMQLGPRQLAESLAAAVHAIAERPAASQATSSSGGGSSSSSATAGSGSASSSSSSNGRPARPPCRFCARVRELLHLPRVQRGVLPPR